MEKEVKEKRLKLAEYKSNKKTLIMEKPWKRFYRCQWPACNKPAADRLFSPQGWIWLCEEHLEEIRKKPQLLKEPIFKPVHAKIGPIPIKLLFLTILGAIGIFYFFTGFFGLLPTPALPTRYSKTLGNSLCLIKCYLGSVWNPSEWMVAGGLGELCKRKCGIIEVEARRLGCIDCYKFDFLPTENFPYTDTFTSLRLIIKAEQKDYCIRVNGVKECKEIEAAREIEFEVIDECKNSYSCKDEKIEGGICTNKINARDTPLEGYVDVWVPCKDRFWVWAKFSYKYTTRGFSYFTLRNPNYKGEITYYKPVSTPGPLKVTIATQQKSFIAKGGNRIPLVIRLLNEGEGEVKIEKIEITQSNPLAKRLVLIDCTPNLFEIEGKGTAKKTYTLTPKKFVLGEFYLKSDEIKDIVCKFEVSKNLADAITDKITQTFIMDVVYKYGIEKSVLFAPEHGEWDCELSRRKWDLYLGRDDKYLVDFTCENCIKYKIVSLPYSTQMNEGEPSFYFRKKIFTKEVDKKTRVIILAESEIKCNLISEEEVSPVQISCKEIEKEENITNEYKDEYKECDVTLSFSKGYQILACKVEPVNQSIYFDLDPIDLKQC